MAARLHTSATLGRQVKFTITATTRVRAKPVHPSVSN